MSEGHFLNYLGELSPLWMWILEQVVPGYIRKVAEQDRGSKLVESMPPWCLPRLLFEFLPCLPSVKGCDQQV